MHGVARENRRLREDVEILKRATAIFSRRPGDGVPVHRGREGWQAQRLAGVRATERSPAPPSTPTWSARRGASATTPGSPGRTRPSMRSPGLWRAAHPRRCAPPGRRHSRKRVARLCAPPGSAAGQPSGGRRPPFLTWPPLAGTSSRNGLLGEGRVFIMDRLEAARPQDGFTQPLQAKDQQERTEPPAPCG
jgi:hypothetical protein